MIDHFVAFDDGCCGDVTARIDNLSVTFGWWLDENNDIRLTDESKCAIAGLLPAEEVEDYIFNLEEEITTYYLEQDLGPKYCDECDDPMDSAEYWAQEGLCKKCQDQE